MPTRRDRGKERCGEAIKVDLHYWYGEESGYVYCELPLEHIGKHRVAVEWVDDE